MLVSKKMFIEQTDRQDTGTKWSHANGRNTKVKVKVNAMIWDAIDVIMPFGLLSLSCLDRFSKAHIHTTH